DLQVEDIGRRMSEGARDRPARAGGARRTRLDRQHLGGAAGPPIRQDPTAPAGAVTDVALELPPGAVSPFTDSVGLSRLMRGIAAVGTAGWSEWRSFCAVVEEWSTACAGSNNGRRYDSPKS
ncbi:MAG: hypothetical protein ACK5UC_04975, partial [Planctomycetaceae bacterium]